ncbi:hypothetical protein PCE1_001885 [Barthelona sp. PCE]
MHTASLRFTFENGDMAEKCLCALQPLQSVPNTTFDPRSENCDVCIEISASNTTSLRKMVSSAFSNVEIFEEAMAYILGQGIEL